MKFNKIAAVLMSVAVMMSSAPFATVANAAENSVSASGVWYESMYAEWTGNPNETFTASYKEAGNVDAESISVDKELIREVKPGSYRLDILGLKADVKYDVEIKDSNSTVAQFSGKPMAYDRSGFAFDDEKDAPGAYNMDGTLADNALVVYVTDENKMNCYNGMSFIKLIGNADKVNNGNPIVLRFIGRINKPLTNIFQVAISRATCGLTLEGVGPDSGFAEWGMNITYDNDIEIRNLVVRDAGEDSFGLYRTKKFWLHNSSIYGGYYPQDDSEEQDKLHGDGSCDLRECDKITVSYNHFCHTDKTCLLGSSAKRVEPTGGITFHHNYFEYTGQRTPRARWHNVHIYNNYYYGTEVYGVAATNNANIFAENNLFEDAASPFLISSQSQYTDKFSTNDGGAIKAYNNQYINTRESEEGLDYFNAPSREYRMTPEDFTAKKGGWTYNNFDADFYIGANNYKLDPVENVKKVVLENCGAQDEDSIEYDNGIYPPYPQGEVTNKYYYDSAETGSTGESYGGVNGEGSFFNGEGTCKAGATEAYFVADKHEYSGCFNTNKVITFTTNSPAKLYIVSGAATEVPVRAEVVNTNGDKDTVYHGTFQTGYKGGTSLSEIELTEAGTYSFTPAENMDIYYIEVNEYNN